MDASKQNDPAWLVLTGLMVLGSGLFLIENDLAQAIVLLAAAVPFVEAYRRRGQHRPGRGDDGSERRSGE